MARKKKKYVIGIDLGGTKMLTAVLGGDFRVLSSVKSKTRVENGEKYFFSTLVESVKLAISEAKVRAADLAAIGMGCPGIIDAEKGLVVSSPNIPFLNHYPLSAKVSRYFDVPAALENDVNAGLYGEKKFGAAKGHENVIGIFIGTGIGGALIFNGELYRGATGAAGEIGHTLIDPAGPLCGCGQRGCLETLAGRVAIASEAAVLAAKQQAPNLFKLAGADLLQIKSGALAKAIAEGDEAIEELIRYKARLIGLAMTNLVNLLSPDLIVLGGGVVEAMPKLIVKEAEAFMKKHAMPAIAKRVSVAAAKLGDFAIVMGAGKLAWELKKAKRKGKG